MSPFIFFTIVYPIKLLDNRDAILKKLRDILKSSDNLPIDDQHNARCSRDPVLSLSAQSFYTVMVQPGSLKHSFGRGHSRCKQLLFILFLSHFFMTPTFAREHLSQFITSRDLSNSNQSSSNISLKNNRNSAVTVYGLYVRQYAYVAAGQSCDSSTVIFPIDVATNNITAGAFVMPTVIGPGRKAIVGSNYLYNMIYGAIFYENIIIPLSPPGCALPGCTWGSDSTQYHWCIYLGALAPVSTSPGYTSNVPPSTGLASNTGLYNYNLTSNYSYIGPISCDDRALTCTAASQQTQTFS